MQGTNWSLSVHDYVIAGNLYLALLLTAKRKQTQELKACRYVRVSHLPNSKFVEIIFYFKILTRSNGEMRGEPKGTATIEAEVTSFN